MKTSLRKCPNCEDYTLHAVCPKCGSATNVPIPPRYSPEDKYGKYRRMLNKQSRD